MAVANKRARILGSGDDSSRPSVLGESHGDDCQGMEGVLGYGSGSIRLQHGSAMDWGCLIAEGGEYWRPV